jgi:hypothetical protein
MQGQTKPFAVYTNAGVFRSEHDTPEQASFAADEANKEALRLGIKTRYEHGERRAA